MYRENPQFPIVLGEIHRCEKKNGKRFVILNIKTRILPSLSLCVELLVSNLVFN